MKKMIFALSLLALLSLFLAPTFTYAGSEGKVDKEIDLPIEKPKIQTIPEEKDPDGPEFYGEELGSESDTLVFVVDFSCSMYGSRIAKAKSEVAKAINSLSKNFKFSVVTYSCYVKTWQSKLVDATDANKSSAIGWVSGQSPNSATDTGTGVKVGLKLDAKNKLVVLLTDGAPNCLGSGWGSGNDHLSVILGANGQKAKIDVFAIQPWGSSMKKFCQDIAQKTGGKFKEVN